MARRSASLKPHLNQIRTWVAEGVTDIWIAHQLESTPASIAAFRRRHGLTRPTAGATAPSDPVVAAAGIATAAPLAEEPGAAVGTALEEDTAPATDAQTDAEESAAPVTETETDDAEGPAPKRRRRGRRGGRGRRRKGAPTANVRTANGTVTIVITGLPASAAGQWDEQTDLRVEVAEGSLTVHLPDAAEEAEAGADGDEA